MLVHARGVIIVTIRPEVIGSSGLEEYRRFEFDGRHGEAILECC